MGFDAGALFFKLQTVGKALFVSDMRDSKQAVEGLESATSKAKTAAEGQGKASDDQAKKSKTAKGALDDQAKATKETGDQADKAKPKQDEQAKASERQAAAAQKLAAGLAVAGLAVSALVGLSVAKWTEFDQAMSQTSAAVMATADEQRALGDAALQAGADTAYSATEAANAEEELAKAGLSVADIVGGSLNGALALAAAGQLQVARSAEIMATTLKQFKLPAEDASHVSDLLAAGAGKAQGSVDDLALALQYVGPVAASMGLSLEETTGALAMFASQGQLGEKAGTGLRGVLMALTSPSKLAARTMGEYGIEIYNTDGSMKSLAGISEQLKRAFSNLTPAVRDSALGMIFGNEQITAARVLYEGGADAVAKWTSEVDDAGYAALQAAKRQDNLAGDVEKLGGAFDTALIKTGSGANDVLRDIVQSVTALIDIFGSAPAPVQQVALVVGVAAAAVLLLSAAAVTARVKFVELKTQLDMTGMSFKSTALAGGLAGIALTGVITVIGILAQRQAEAQQRAQSYADTLEAGTAKITKSTRDMVATNLTAEQSWLWLSTGSAADNAAKLGVDLDTLADAAMGNADAQQRMAEVMRAGGGDIAAVNKIARENNLTNMEASAASTQVAEAIERESIALGTAKDITAKKNEITKAGVGVTEDAAAAYLDAAKQANELTQNLGDLIEAISKSNEVGQDAITRNVNYQDTLAKVDEAIANARKGVDGHSRTLDINTQAGRDNTDMLVKLAQDAQAAAAAQYNLDGNTQAYRKTLEDSRQAFIDRAMRFGAVADEAERLAEQIFSIPTETEWQLIADTAAAQQRVGDFINGINGKRVRIIVDAVGGQAYQISGTNVKFNADGGNVKFFAGGGEHHVAQFARAGDYRVWAEPETGGEWYIPEAPSKRDRSLTLTRQMVNGWGYDLVPTGTSAPTVSSTTSTTRRGGDVHVTFVNPQMRDAITDANTAAGVINAAAQLPGGD